MACCGRHLGERVDFSRRAAEAGAFEQMRGEIAIPIFGGDGSEIVLPGGGSGGLGEGGSDVIAAAAARRAPRESTLLMF